MKTMAIEIIVQGDSSDTTYVKCPNCKSIIKQNELREYDGHYGCDRLYRKGQCFFDDLIPKIINGELDD